MPLPFGRHMKIVFALLGILAAGQAFAQNFEAGRSGWQLERLSDDFVLLRTDITAPARGDRSTRQGLLILACEPGGRRIRFQIGNIPKNPSIYVSSQGRAIVRGWFGNQSMPSLPVYPAVQFFEDGSFEFKETAGFSDSIMRGMLGLLRKVPSRLEVVLFKGTETRSFRRGTAMEFSLQGLDSNLGDIYGFEGLCFHSNN